MKISVSLLSNIYLMYEASRLLKLFLSFLSVCFGKNLCNRIDGYQYRLPLLRLAEKVLPSSASTFILLALIVSMSNFILFSGP